jgi:SAM-dependent methyltransferase
MEHEEYRRMAAVEQSHWWYRATRSLLQQILAPLLTAPAGRRLELFDAGSGTGATGAWLADHGDLVALDVEPMALALYEELHPGARRLAGDLTAIGLKDDSVDGALCVTVLYHQAIASPAAAVAELARVVRPGGFVCLMEPGGRRLLRAHDRVTHTARRFSRSDLEGLIAGAGLELVASTGAYSFLVPPAWVKMQLERGDTSRSDLDANQSGLGGVLSALAWLERAVLRRFRLPVGLSVIAVGRKPLR